MYVRRTSVYPVVCWLSFTPISTTDQRKWVPFVDRNIDSGSRARANGGNGKVVLLRHYQTISILPLLTVGSM